MPLDAQTAAEQIATETTAPDFAASRKASSSAADAETPTQGGGVRLDARPFRTFVRLGDIDCHGDLVERVYERTETVEIYRARSMADPQTAESCMLRVMIDADEPRAAEMRSNLAPLLDAVMGVCDVVAGVRPLRVWSRVLGEPKDILRERTYKMIARAVIVAIDGNVDDARRMIEVIRAEVEARRDSVNRMRYVFVNALSLTGFLALIAGAGAIGLNGWAGFAVNGQLVAAQMLALGVVGAFFSVAVSLPRLAVNHAISVPEMVYAGFVRIPIGLIAALVAMLLISAGWVFDGATDPNAAAATVDADVAKAFLVAFVAGFSEAFVPNALNRVAEAGGRRAG